MNELPSARPQGHGAVTTLQAFRLLTRQPDYLQLQGSWSLSLSLGKTHNVLNAQFGKALAKIEIFSRSYNKSFRAYLLTLPGLAAKYHLKHMLLKLKMRQFKALLYEIDALNRENLGDRLRLGRDAPSP
jgi:hypothetical protein